MQKKCFIVVARADDRVLRKSFRGRSYNFYNHEKLMTSEKRTFNAMTISFILRYF